MLTRLAGLAVGLAAASAMIIGAAIITSGHSSAAPSPSTSPPTQQTPGGRDQDNDGPGHMGTWFRDGQGAVGRVTKVAGNTITVQTPDGQTVTVTVTGSTTFHGRDTSASLNSITPGTTIAAFGTKNGTTVQATSVMVFPPHASGTVTKVDGTTITISPGPDRFGGTSVTKIVTSKSTTFGAPGSASATSTTIKVGDLIIAEGTLSADGTTLQAGHVLIASPGTMKMSPFGGHLFPHGRFGPGTWGDRGDWGRQQFVAQSGPSV